MKIKRWTIYDKRENKYIDERYIFRANALRSMNQWIRARAMVDALEAIRTENYFKVNTPAYTTFEVVELA